LLQRYYSYWAAKKQGCYPANLINNKQRNLIVKACRVFGNNTETIDAKVAIKDGKIFGGVAGRNTFKWKNIKMPKDYTKTKKHRQKYDPSYNKRGANKIYKVKGGGRRGKGGVPKLPNQPKIKAPKIPKQPKIKAPKQPKMPTQPKPANKQGAKLSKLPKLPKTPKPKLFKPAKINVTLKSDARNFLQVLLNTLRNK
jgi:hypothetical protein